MSILLDAVTRDKQQSQGVTHDVVLTPRAQYKARQERGKGLKYAAVFVSLLLLMILAAWLLSKVWYPQQALSQGLEQSVSVNRNLVSTRPASIEPEQAQTVKRELSSDSGEDIRLAGKVALPVAEPRVVAASVVPANSALADEQANNLMAAIVKAEQSIEQGPNPVPSQHSNDEPIILGANSNHRGNELLESLKEQVEDAANDVGLKTAEPATNNNLLAAFEAALKDVERDNAVATPVTEPKLDPIPTTPKLDDIPKYGQLPAGLQLQVPEFNINAHVYSSAPDNRWLNVDGAELQEGDSIQGKLTIVEIRPRDVVLAIQGTEFKVPAI